ncbi:hypothetical protein CJ030_MR6G013197 [Morella rubra]|uniref:Uncharacterized protein n=1 Tax=Morella rubra TaxID=262757 RepID=A0A6A1VAV5_9ROSI|nr:hypothetical protein CJ030_MR6G013197 [Morella rubra]
MPKLRQYSPSPKLSGSALLSAKSRYRQRRNIPQEDEYNDDYSDASASRSLYEPNEEEEEYERPRNGHEESSCEVKERMRELWIRKRKEKEDVGFCAKSTMVRGSHETGKELVRSVSIGASSSTVGRNEGEDRKEKAGGFMGGKKK